MAFTEIPRKPPDLNAIPIQYALLPTPTQCQIIQQLDNNAFHPSRRTVSIFNAHLFPNWNQDNPFMNNECFYSTPIKFKPDATATHYTYIYIRRGWQPKDILEKQEISLHKAIFRKSKEIRNDISFNAFTGYDPEYVPDDIYTEYGEFNYLHLIDEQKEELEYEYDEGISLGERLNNITTDWLTDRDYFYYLYIKYVTFEYPPLSLQTIDILDPNLGKMYPEIDKLVKYMKQLKMPLETMRKTYTDIIKQWIESTANSGYSPLILLGTSYNDMINAYIKWMETQITIDISASNNENDIAQETYDTEDTDNTNNHILLSTETTPKQKQQTQRLSIDKAQSHQRKDKHQQYQTKQQVPGQNIIWIILIMSISMVLILSSFIDSNNEQHSNDDINYGILNSYNMQYKEYSALNINNNNTKEFRYLTAMTMGFETVPDDDPKYQQILGTQQGVIDKVRGVIAIQRNTFNQNQRLEIDTYSQPKLQYGQSYSIFGTDYICFGDIQQCQTHRYQPDWKQSRYRKMSVQYYMEYKYNLLSFGNTYITPNNQCRVNINISNQSKRDKNDGGTNGVFENGQGVYRKEYIINNSNQYQLYHTLNTELISDLYKPPVDAGVSGRYRNRINYTNNYLFLELGTYTQNIVHSATLALPHSAFRYIGSAT